MDLHPLSFADDESITNIEDNPSIQAIEDGRVLPQLGPGLRSQIVVLP